MQDKIIPGLLDSNSYEFFNHQSEIKFVNNGQVKSFYEAPFNVISILQEAIDNNPEGKAILMDWFPNSGFKQLEKYVSCRFGGIDYSPDLLDGKLQEGEFWNCPKRGNCPGENILCSPPTVNGNKLSNIEIKLTQLLTTDKTNEVIADYLDLPLGTFHKLKRELYEKFGSIQTKQALTKKAYNLNII
ncbi:helix-turn-helix transcriptional regulator [Flavobacterium sp. HNIBRBA15423]|uniref:helix-turn-helix transcriptional regulator n=1 Tax=Flavobacterium sp. HNIBRBA15423 TaxID=3458683 RepID=UPI004044AB48